MSNIKFYAPVDFDDTSSGLTIDGDLIVDTDTLFVDVSADKVGIGTTSPLAHLHIKPSSSSNAFSNIDGLLVENNGSSNSYYVLQVATAGGGKSFSITNAGNIGIGTSSPDQKLHVHKGSAGTVASATNSIITAENSTSGYLSILVPDANESGILFGRPTSNVDGGILYNSNVSRGLEFRTNGNSAKMVVDSSGNVGIGTTSPSRQLHILGDYIRMGSSSRIIIESASASKIQFKNTGGSWLSTESKGINIGDWSTDPSYGDVRVGDYDFDVIKTDGTHLIKAKNNGNVLIGTTTDSGYKLNVNGTGYFSSTLTLGGGSRLSAVSGNGLNFNTGGSDVMHIDTSGNVGVGTTSPSAQLHVYSSGNGEIEVQRASGALINLQAQASLGTIGTDSNHPLYLKTNSATRAAILTNGNVGIGTISPAQKLHVSGRARVDNNAQALDIVGTDHVYHAWYPRGTSGGRKAYMGYAGSNTTDFTLMNQDTGAFILGTNNAERLRIISNGNVGIGTTSPSYKLEIKGTSNNIGDGNQIFSVGNTSGGTQLAIGSSENSYTWIRSYESGVGGRDLSLVTNGEAIRIKSGGNVLIGTNTDSGYKLDVSGKIAMLSDGTLLWGSAFDFGKLTYDTGKAIVRGASGKALSLGANNTQDTIYINTSQNVGIGTASPSSKLHVVGDFFLKGSDTSSSTKNLQVQTGNGTSIMDFRNDAYAFFGCGQGGGSASGFIFRYNSTFGVQFTGYNYGNGTSPSYKPILMDTDLAGRSQGVYVNYGITGYTAPAPTSDTEFAVRGRGTGSNYTAKFEDSSTNPLLYIKDNGNVTVGTATDSGYKLDVEGNTNTNGDYYVNNNQGWSGTITIDQSPNPSIDITVEGGIITNVT